MYNTVEAILDNNKVIFEDWFNFSNKKSKILITFIDDNIDDNNLYELEEKYITNEILFLKDNVLKKDKKLFTNI